MKSSFFRGTVYVHVLPDTKILVDGRLVELGREYKASPRYLREIFGKRIQTDRPVGCAYGMHALDTGDQWVWNYPNAGAWICVVRVNTKVERLPGKVVGLRRKVVAWRQVMSSAQAELLIEMNPEQVIKWVYAGGEVAR